MAALKEGLFAEQRNMSSIFFILRAYYFYTKKAKQKNSYIFSGTHSLFCTITHPACDFFYRFPEAEMIISPYEYCISTVHDGHIK